MSEHEVRLKEMSLRELKELASVAGIVAESVSKREDLITKLAPLPNIGNVMAAWENSLPRLLEEKSVKDLRKIAEDHGIDVTNLKRKKDVIEAIASHPASGPVAESLRSVRKLDSIKGELEEVKADIDKTVSEAVTPPLEDAASDPLLRQALSLDVDFDYCEDLLEQARMRFEERNFEGALGTAIEAKEAAERCRKDLENALGAYAILSAQRLVEECGKVSGDVERAADLLRTAKRLYREGGFFGEGNILRNLETMSRGLYSVEVQKAREHIHTSQELIHDVANLGADVRQAEESLGRARDALRHSEYQACIQHAVRAAELAEIARQDRIKSLEDAIPATVAVIEEARHVGADLSEAERLVSKAKTAIASKDYLLASELVKRSERAAMESQQSQILKAMELRRRQVEKAQSIITQIEPVIEEAESFAIDVTEPRTLLQQAKDILAEGDYVNGTIFAKNAAEVVKKLEPKLVDERAKRGIAKPTEGVCASCGSRYLDFADNGWSMCKDCGYTFRWRAPGGVWSRFKSLWKG